ncbi:MAG: hypothetical protein A3F83_03520 [Candidatus Glassbacteria bacterium RIFCSPLOWO2_12_FULL_58_11]|uniref:Co-chaperone DjlA N-terminal domain-containing protein n=1 Tax=Candidatus Glassbacteria bacterium RIFCSPLOWO2_12_FULL_58_11 TaxID=1817867 RepID=A0A1F5YXZ6_9BACT|nr:MAG: hypothetical protein A3F83_03520 [Candidatus Glassbacteria bacterium RIFCSPLOWO2_12_FULL_58_11]
MTRVSDLLILTPNFILEPARELTEEELIDYIAVLHEVARIHGVTMEEKKFETYLISSLGVNTKIVQKALQIAADQSNAFGNLVARIKDPAFRVCLFRDAYLMFRQDKVVDQVEWLALDRLGGALGLPEKLSRKVIQLVDDLIQLQHEFHKLASSAE